VVSAAAAAGDGDGDGGGGSGGDTVFIPPGYGHVTIIAQKTPKSSNPGRPILMAIGSRS